MLVHLELVVAHVVFVSVLVYLCQKMIALFLTYEKFDCAV